MATQESRKGGYRSKLLHRADVADGTMALHFKRPSQFDFTPGQSADLTLFNPPETDSEGNTPHLFDRKFSIRKPFDVRHPYARHSIQSLIEESNHWCRCEDRLDNRVLHAA